MISCLVLVPTAIELQHLPVHFLQAIERKHAAIDLCGFGPVVAAARAASLIASHRPVRVVLCGVAGAICESLEVARAYRFDAVACYGIGVGDGQAFKSASAMGWRQWAGSVHSDGDGKESSSVIEDVIQLSQPVDLGASRLLLTSCAASQDKFEVARKRAAFPNALAEDMEGFAVAVACQLAGVPLSIVRGISNVAGDRGHSRWKIAEAMLSAVTLVEEMNEI